MNRRLPILVFMLCLTLPVWASSEASETIDSCLAAPAQSGITANPLPEKTDPAPDLGLFAPKLEKRGCFMDCVNEWNATMCSGLTGSEQQQCVNDGAEGCRCGCGGYCP